MKKTIPWDAARVASLRALPKPRKLHAAVGLLSHGQGDSLVCTGCRYQVCACDTNRKFDERALVVGDVLIGKSEPVLCSAHAGDAIVVTQLDVVHSPDNPLLGVRYIARSWVNEAKWFRYGYLREYFRTTGFRACAEHHTMWDTKDETRAPGCMMCWAQAGIFKSVAEHVLERLKEPNKFLPNTALMNTVGNRQRVFEALKDEPAEVRSAALDLIMTGNVQAPLSRPPQMMRPCPECFMVGRHVMTCGLNPMTGGVIQRREWHR